MGNEPSTSTVTKTLQMGTAPGPRHICCHFDPSLVRRDELLYTVAMTPGEARETARILLEMAADTERIAVTRGRP